MHIDIFDIWLRSIHQYDDDDDDSRLWVTKSRCFFVGEVNEGSGGEERGGQLFWNEIRFLHFFEYFEKLSDFWWILKYILNFFILRNKRIPYFVKEIIKIKINTKLFLKM